MKDQTIHQCPTPSSRVSSTSSPGCFPLFGNSSSPGTTALAKRERKENDHLKHGTVKALDAEVFPSRNSFQELAKGHKRRVPVAAVTRQDVDIASQGKPQCNVLSVYSRESELKIKQGHAPIHSNRNPCYRGRQLKSTASEQGFSYR